MKELRPKSSRKTNVLHEVIRHLSIPLLALLFVACQTSAPRADAYGNFEADERIVSAEASGRILALSLEEGQVLKAGVELGAVDSVQLVLKREQLLAGIQAIAAKSPAIRAQLAVFDKQMASVRQQLATLDREKGRLENRVKSDAATSTPFDELNAQVVLTHHQSDGLM